MKWLMVFLIAQPLTAFAEDISLNAYLQQVREKDDDYVASQKSMESEELTGHEGEMALATNLFANASHTSDAKPNLLFDYQKLITDSYQLGVNQQTSIGLSGKLYYNLQYQQYQGLAFGGPPETITGLQGSPTVELTMPIWRNWFGHETKSLIEQNDAGTAAKRFGDSYKMKTILLQAESAYWALALARETVKVQQDALDRAIQLNKFNVYKADSGLADRADVLQTQAAVEARQLDLKAAKDDETSSARSFNSLRGRDSAEVVEALGALSTERLGKLETPPRAELRDDTRSALEQRRSSVAGSQASLEKYKPTLELFGTAALNNPNPTNTDTALARSFDGSRPTDTIGVRFSAPLDFGLIHDIRAGWAAQLHAAETSYQRRLFEQEQQWSDLKDKFQQAKDRLTIYDRLEKVQKVKLDYERVRRQRGRTTTQQVLLFEQDYEQAQLGRIRTMSEILQLLAQMKTYDGERTANESR